MEATVDKSITIKVDVDLVLSLGVKDVNAKTAAKEAIITSEGYLRKLK